MSSSSPPADQQYTFKSTGPKTRPPRMKPNPSPPPPLIRPRCHSSSSISSTTSFTSAVSNHNHPSEAQPPRFSPAEESQMLSTSHTLKSAANTQFAAADYSSAISTYDKALAELPAYLDYEMAVLQSNIAACHLRLRDWKAAVESAEQGLEGLEREMPMPKAKGKGKGDEKTGGKGEEKEEGDGGKVVELPEDQDEEDTAEVLRKLNLSDQRKDDIRRIRTKLLLRRARAKVMLCDDTNSTTDTNTVSAKNNTNAHVNGNSNDEQYTTTLSSPPNTSSQPQLSKTKPAPETASHWSNLSTALSDYQTLATPEYFRGLPQSDQKTVITMLRELPGRVEAAKKREVDEMMGKLKELGNGILKPFGLSTDMFKMTQDPTTGGWSMGFDGGGKK